MGNKSPVTSDSKVRAKAAISAFDDLTFMALTCGSSTNLRDAGLEVAFGFLGGFADVLRGAWTRLWEIPDDNDELELAREDTLETLLLELEEEEEEPPQEIRSVLILLPPRAFFASTAFATLSLFLAKSIILTITPYSSFSRYLLAHSSSLESTGVEKL